MREIILPQTINEPLVLGLGFFDCVHLGHRALIDTVKSFASAHDALTAITTFSNNPYRIFNSHSKLIYTYDERLSLFNKVGLDFCIPFKFDSFFKDISRDNFLHKLFSSFNIKGLVCGYDYLFGAGGKGDSAYLKKYCASNGVDIAVIEPILYENERVSSTLVKTYIEKGDIKRLNTFLTEPYFMTGEIVHGKGIGKQYSIPTANLHFAKDKLLLKKGVYATKIYIDGECMRSVTFIGSKPTFNEPTVTCETFIERDVGNIYGKNVKIEFYKFLRDVKKFDTADELAKQIHIDLLMP